MPPPEPASSAAEVLPGLATEVLARDSRTRTGRWAGDRLLVFLLVIAALLMLASTVGPMVVGGDATAPELQRRLLEPSWLGGDGGFLGTDELGRPLLLRILLGMQTSFVIGVGAVVVGATLGTTLGMVAGYRGGSVDTVVMRVADVQMSLPSFLFALTLLSVFSSGRLTIVAILGLNSWMLYARVARTNVVRLRSSDLVLAEVALGARATRVLVGHVLPNTAGPLVAVATLEFARLMLAEGALSFLGFGVSPPDISLGAILAGGQEYLQTDWWVSIFSGLVLALLVLVSNLIGSALQQRWAAGEGSRGWSLS